MFLSVLKQIANILIFFGTGKEKNEFFSTLCRLMTHEQLEIRKIKPQQTRIRYRMGGGLGNDVAAMRQTHMQPLFTAALLKEPKPRRISDSVYLPNRIGTIHHDEAQKTYSRSNFNHLIFIGKIVLCGFKAECHLILEREEIFDFYFLYHIARI